MGGGVSVYVDGHGEVYVSVSGHGNVMGPLADTVTCTIAVAIAATQVVECVPGGVVECGCRRVR